MPGAFAHPKGCIKTTLTHESKIVMPMAIMGAKFYMSLTLPTPLKAFKSREDFYTSIHKLSMLDAQLQPHILDNAFFSGLDKLFLEHLYPSFQAFGMPALMDARYNQNRAPAVDDDEEEEEKEEEEEEVKAEDILSLDWRGKFEKEYMPAVKKFVERWVHGRKKMLIGKMEVEALNGLAEKVAAYVTIGDKDKEEGMPNVIWQNDSMGLPLVTPMFLRALMSELNVVDEAVVSVCG